ncbi:hypothetical protein SISSUDRAFT_1096005 [Sistotremastrum suecicum HHB10207 ss-3]|nr:hypothetical protein SISSUDRAFT_1096005 [Sistotremastrum suecicum HHB10207 ss-3]
MFAASYLSTSPYHVASPSPLPSLDPSLPRSVSFAAPIITPTPSPFQPPILEHHYSYDSDEPAYILGHSTDSAPSSLHASSPFSDSSSEQEAAIYVHSFSPEYGEAGTMLTVVVELPPSLRNGNKARLAINGTPLLTNMTEAPSRISDGMWELNACVPVVGKRDASTSTPEMLAIVIEAFNDEGRHIHTIDVGQFSYSSPGKANLPPLSMSSSEITPHSTPTNPLKRRAREEDDDDDDDADYTPRAASHPRKHRKTRSGDKWTTSRSSCSPKTAKRVPPKLDLVNDAAGHKFLSPPIMSPLVRAGTYAPLSDDPAPKGMISPGSNADVKFEGDLSDMAHSW